MGRYLESSCKLCRREGVKLMLKGIRCESAKCPIEKRERNVAPGMHSWRRGKLSDYGVRLREKQKVKRFYGLFEKQFKNAYRAAERMRGNTGENLLMLLERRFDNVIYKLNFAPSRKAARQLVSHGHFCLNGRKCDIPSLLVKPGDKITLKKSEKSSKKVKEQIESNPNFTVQAWLQLDMTKPEATVVANPAREDVQLPIEENLVVEFCSK